MSIDASDVTVEAELFTGSDSAQYSFPSVNYVTTRSYYLLINSEDNSQISANNAIPATIVTGSHVWEYIISSTRDTNQIRAYKLVPSSASTEFTVLTYPAVQRYFDGLIVSLNGTNLSDLIVQSRGAPTSGTNYSITAVSPVTPGNIIIAGFATTGTTKNWVAGSGQTALSSDLTAVRALYLYNLNEDNVLDAAISTAQQGYCLVFEVAAGSGAIVLNAEPSNFKLRGSQATLGAAKNSEGANGWFNNNAWASPTWGTPSKWWSNTGNFKMIADPSNFKLTGGSAALIVTVNNIILNADPSNFKLTGTDAFLGQARDVVLFANSGNFKIKGSIADLSVSGISYGLGNNVLEARQYDNKLFSQLENSTVLYSINWAAELNEDKVVKSTWILATGSVELSGLILQPSFTSLKVTGRPGRYVITNKIITKQGISKQRQLIIIINDDRRNVTDYQ